MLSASIRLFHDTRFSSTMHTKLQAEIFSKYSISCGGAQDPASKTSKLHRCPLSCPSLVCAVPLGDVLRHILQLVIGFPPCQLARLGASG